MARLAWFAFDAQAAAQVTAELLRTQQAQVAQARRMQATIAEQQGQVLFLSDALADQAESLAAQMKAIEDINAQILHAVGLDTMMTPTPRTTTPMATPPADSPTEEAKGANIGPLQPLLPDDRGSTAQAATRSGLERAADAIALLGLLEQQLPGKLDQQMQLRNQVNDRLAKLSNKPSDPEEIRAQLQIYDAAPKGWPVRGRITSPFGLDPNRRYLGAQANHRGVDIAATWGTPIQVQADGLVTSVRQEEALGLLVEIRHSLGWSTLYGHLSRVAVRVGDIVTAGQIIAYVGNTGLSTGPHLHYEIHFNGVPIDPARYLGR